MGNLPANGTVGTDLDVDLALGNRRLKEMIINAPLVNDDATLEIWVDSKIANNKIFDGYMANRDSNGAISFIDNLSIQDNTKFIVSVTGGSGNLFVNAIFE